MTDQSNEPKWHTDVLSVDPSAPIELGDTVTWEIKYMGKNRYVSEVTTFEPMRKVVLTAREGPMKPVLTHSFTSEGPSTTYTRQIRIPLEGWFRLLGPIMKATGAARRRNARFAENLRRLMEAANVPA